MNTLVVKRLAGLRVEFELFLENNENVVWFIEEDDDFPFAFKVSEYEDGERTYREIREYREFGVDDIFDIIELIYSDPEKMLKELTGRELKIDRVVEW
ncbi:MAG: hypothetical protein JHC26_04425 [Thermofilum sp.]|jgi:hypothetical protein|uniref:hypothetical protein n=1 Tax=Thermofilum sp. TaxID=1961369 RepID=UPI0025849E5C|nr:hypothetical protein [Thermofilum sp.]MCI4408313.1 hypothetical protein [Thermofilum sp.]